MNCSVPISAIYDDLDGRWYGRVLGWHCCRMSGHWTEREALRCAAWARERYELMGELPTLRNEAYIWRAG